MNKFRLGCALVAVMSFAQAQESNWYIGASAGQTKVDSGITTTSAAESLDEKDTGYKVFGGYQYNQYLAAELYYADLGSVTYSNGTTTSIESDVKSYGIAGVVSYPLHKHIEPFVKAGIQHWKGKVTGTALNQSFNVVGDGNKALYGVGVNFPITEYFSFRTEYEVIKLDEEDYKFLSAGIVYNF